MTGLEIAAIIGAGAAAVSGGASAISGGKMNRRSVRYAKYENELNRKFQAEQAEIGRQWQEEQYNKYYSPAAQMASFQKAGINPAFAVGNISGTGSVSSPSPSGGSSIGISQENPFTGLTAGLSSAYDAMALKNETTKLGYEANLMKAQENDLIKSALLKGETINLTKAQVESEKALKDKIGKEIEKIGADINLSKEQINKLQQEVISIKKDNELKEYQISVNNQYAELSKKLGLPVNLTENIVGQCINAVGNVVSGGLQALGQLGSFGAKAIEKVYDTLRGKGKMKLNGEKRDFYPPGSTIDWTF